MSTTTELNAQLEAATAELESALGAGQPTRSIRTKITRLEGELTALRNAEATAQRNAADKKVAEIQSASQALADTQHTQLDAAAACPELEQLGEQVPAAPRSPKVEAAAAEVAAARAALDDAERIHRNLLTAAGKIQTRLTEEQAKVDAIKQRRSNGDKRDDDAGAMTLLGDDIADLQRLQAGAQAKASAADPHAQVRALEQAHQRLDRAQAEVAMVVFNDRLQLAEAAFLRAYTAQRAAERAAGLYLSNPSGTYRANIELKSIISRH
jgi:hypothetical protein